MGPRLKVLNSVTAFSNPQKGGITPCQRSFKLPVSLVQAETG